MSSIFTQLLTLSFVLFSLAPLANANSAKTDKNIKEQKVNHKQAKESQVKVSSVTQKTQTIVDKYRLVLRKIENTKVYNRQLEEFIQSQKNEMVSMKEKIQTLKRTNKEIIPLMVRMTDTIENFVKLDLPFLPKERQRRVTQLKDMMKRADVSTSEKYRRIFEAYQVENDYGRTIEAYKGPQVVEGNELTVDFLRVGRIGLFYQSLDGAQSGIWDPKQKSWAPMPSGFQRSLRDGLRMARKQQAPNLLKLPLQTATNSTKKEVL